MMFEHLPPMAPSIFGALVAGGVIGFEREWRGRPAGLRTHIIVSLASALLMLASMSQADWAFHALPEENIVTDPTRMAHGILTGIGFLCAGVIFRTGFTVHGLTTAASLWITSAIGILFGAGLYGLGIAATLTTASVLIVLRAISARMPTRAYVDVEVSWRRGDDGSEAAIEAGLQAIDKTARPGIFELIEDGRVVRRTWRVGSGGETDMKLLAWRLCEIEGVIGYRFVPRDD
ncbi:MgtC/SapB family protein [Brevundimonas goettingensis]|nr:MgtC/SapB family protein [Brevundimonas goettingensis]